jgi:hypothetical protein
MSAISEAKELIAAASEAAAQAIEAASRATDKLDQAIGALNLTAGDTGHENIDNALKRYRAAADGMASIKDLLRTAQESADEYAEALG